VGFEEQSTEAPQGRSECFSGVRRFERGKELLQTEYQHNNGGMTIYISPVLGREGEQHEQTRFSTLIRQKGQKGTG